MAQLKDITPKQFSCTFAACPALYQTNEGDFVIVGKKADAQELGIADKVGKDQEAVIMDKEMLEKVFK